VFIPLHDDNPLKVIPFQYVTVGLIAINVLAYLWTLSGVPHAYIASFAVVPNELFSAGSLGAQVGLDQAVAVPEGATLLTHMFLHGGFFHILGNMLFLWVFGDNVEDSMGHGRFLVFYLLCGLAAALTHAAIMPDSNIPMIGASGAVAGVIAAYLMLHPRVQVWVLAFKVIGLRVSAAIALGVWVITQIIMVITPGEDQVAWWAHIGGLVAGAILIVFFKKPDVPLFDRAFRTDN